MVYVGAPGNVLPQIGPRELSALTHAGMHRHLTMGALSPSVMTGVKDSYLTRLGGSLGVPPSSHHGRLAGST